MMSQSEKKAPAHIMFAIPSLGAGGSERVITIIANFWAAQGRPVSIVTFDAPDQAPFYPLAPSISLIRLGLPAISNPLWRALAQTRKRISALRAVFMDRRPDVIISFLTKMNVMALRAADDLAIPVIISERNNPNIQYFNRLWRLARARTYPKAFSFVTMTRGAADYYPPKQRPRTTIIPNPINLPEGWRNQRGNKTLTAVGRLTGQKRFDILIDAFSLVAAEFPEWTLVIWGEGLDRRKLETHRDQFGLHERIKMPGLTSAPGLWIETADIFVLSSDHEGWANVILEAMAAGLPIISTNCPYGPADLIDHDHSGLLTPVGDRRALADGLRTLLSDAALRTRLSANALKASKQYSTEAIVGQWDQLVQSAIQNRKR